MTWWQVLLVFVGIPLAMSAVITIVVLLTSHPKVPAGIAAATAAADSVVAEGSKAADQDPAPRSDQGPACVDRGSSAG